MHYVHNYVSECAVAVALTLDTDCHWATQLHSRFRHGQRPLFLASTGNLQVIGARSLFTAMSIYGAYFMKAWVQRIKRQLWWSNVNVKSQGMYAIFNPSLWWWKRKYLNSRSGTLRKFCANKREGLTFCITVIATWKANSSNLKLHNTTWRWHTTSAKVHAASARSQRPNS